ncbi:tectonic-3 [Gastrophryne carolinensis]
MAADGALWAFLVIVLAVWNPIQPTRGTSAGVTICPCDLSPGNCDLDCCCDPDCTLSSSSSIFSSCLPGSTKAESWACLCSWLIFRNNTPYTTALVGSPPTQLFCVLSADASLNYFVTPQKVGAANFTSISDPHRGPSFSPASQSVPGFSSFYRAGDPVLAVSPSGAVGVLRQPAPVGLQNICSDNNPAKFLQGGSTSCLRVFSNLTDSCETNPALDSAHYYQGVAVLRVPVGVSDPAANLVPVSSSVTTRPLLQGDQCHNAVSEVIYTVRYNGTLGIASVSANFILQNVSGTSLKQTFTVLYEPVTATGGGPVQTRSGNPGYLAGYPVLSDIGALSVPRSLGGESCSQSPVQFGINSLSGCAIRGTAQDSCSDFQGRVYQVLLPGGAPQSLAMFGNATTTQSGHWTPIIYRNCSGQGDCSTGCPIPVILDMQIMWANVGPLSNPQAQLLRALFLSKCRPVRCQDTTVLQTLVSFTDLTRRGPAPRSSPGITGRDPVDFFFPFKSNAAVTKAGSLLLCLLLLACGSSEIIIQ